ncbi:ribosome biogenesis protein BRX1 homolog isoform X1 [Hydra vulgaris]|uniref:ribosome biogenesis protein BRX1 homolog isoform X1 n=2 Tax=Hydra vulgaris TaxID=6087 RepID=UPI001F5F8697|nr:ribosome biogenesis protein BRX1 homolog isoform X1 [Hydra vulgaris]
MYFMYFYVTFINRIQMAPIRNLEKLKQKKQKKTALSKTINVATKENDNMKWINKERVLVFCQRGINFRARHLMLDLRTLMPHSRADNKLDRKDRLSLINEICEMKNCNKCIFFEMKKKKDLYMWISNTPNGPSARFLVENVHTMDELKLTGNSLKGSRPILSFDKKFDDHVQHKLLKEMFMQAFATPNRHPKSKPFIDRVMTFTIVEHRIWIRNFQIVSQKDFSLTEIGPRFVLNLIRIFNKSFCGSTIYENPHYISPNEHRRNIRKAAAFRYLQRQQSKTMYNDRLNERAEYVEESLDDIFHTVTQADLNEAKSKAEKQ